MNMKTKPIIPMKPWIKKRCEVTPAPANYYIRTGERQREDLKYALSKHYEVRDSERSDTLIVILCDDSLDQLQKKLDANTIQRKSSGGRKPPKGKSVSH